jgi:PKHD-type hydroxylase
LAEHSYYPLINIKERRVVLSVDHFFDVEELEYLKSCLSEEKPSAALVGATDPLSDDEYNKRVTDAHQYRKSNVCFLNFYDYEFLYQKLCTAIHHVNITNFNKILYGIEPLQYAEYDSKYSGFYGVHPDARNTDDALTRSLSFSMQLSAPEEYEGGELLVYDGNTTYTANKKYGSITFFDSRMFHEVTPVTSGFRKSLVGWILGPRV